MDRDERSYCNACGSPLPQPPVVSLVCGKCGSDLGTHASVTRVLVRGGPGGIGVRAQLTEAFARSGARRRGRDRK